MVFTVATGLSVLAAFASLLRGGRYLHPEERFDRPENAPPRGPQPLRDVQRQR